MNYAPELTGIGKYSHEMAVWLHKKTGAQIRVICSAPYYPQWEIYSGHKNKYTIYSEDNITLFRCPIYIPKRITSLTRILHLISYAATSSLSTLYQMKWKPDLILCVAPNLLGAIVPVLIGKIIGAKTWLHIQDLEIDAAERLGMIKSKLLLKLLYKIESIFFNNFCKITTISEGMKDQLIIKGVDSKKIGLMPNWANTNEIYPIPKNHLSIKEYINKLKVPQDSKIALYSGSISEKQGLEELILSSEHLSSEKIIILICGNGPNLENLKRIAAGNQNIRFINLVPKEELNLLLNIADVHLLIQKNEIDDQVMPSKLANMIACGGPIVATVNDASNINSLITKYNLGLTTQPGKPDLLAHAIELITSDNAMKLRIAQNCSIYCQNNLSIDQILRSNFLD
jgi:colanic acid biosynthesis glycosyl transferase WcaI